MTIFLPEGSPLENLQALAEVSGFGITDMGDAGEGPWTYRILPEPLLTAELARLSGASTRACVDITSLQPCPAHVATSQDRYVTQEWDIAGGIWLFNAVLDGHLNHHTVDYVSRTLPSRIMHSLELMIGSDASVRPERVSSLLRDSIIDLDKTIHSEFLDLFSLPNQIEQLTDLEIAEIFSNNNAGRHSYEVAMRCLGGTTVVLSLTDPGSKNLWVANLGDCQAVLVQRGIDRQWIGSQINTLHNATNAHEVQRFKNEHPNEMCALRDGRILGFLEPMRAIGDMWLKLPRHFSERIFPNICQRWISPIQFAQYAQDIYSPPYVSNIPDIFHLNLRSSAFALILCSDGLPSLDYYQDTDMDVVINRWSKLVGSYMDSSRGNQHNNIALCLLRDGLGGEDNERVSRNLTVEMEERWMDDVTILVQRRE
ncbi:protein serine/threonine phosphatase 2C [Crucibulum laeve]|uniref:Protein serine/threonine phosphatase 2C n=1 Tax=Crucibulum laeve TaxID=68775 RepID=A0A5C3MT97_9AGAR|nr:protein serine/threonine phosphatase 2C [Crucibulum laeve]